MVEARFENSLRDLYFAIGGFCFLQTRPNFNFLAVLIFGSFGRSR